MLQNWKRLFRNRLDRSTVNRRRKRLFTFANYSATELLEARTLLAADLAALSVVPQATMVEDGGTLIIAASIKNNGTTTISSYQFGFTLNTLRGVRGPTLDQLFTRGPLAPGEIDVFTQAVRMVRLDGGIITHTPTYIGMSTVAISGEPTSNNRAESSSRVSIVADLPDQDTTPPTASATVSDITTAGATFTDIVVRYADNVAVDASTIGANDILVSGPNGSLPVTYIGRTSNSDGTPISGTYRLDAPGGSWDASDNGAYRVTVNSSRVFDTSGNSVRITGVDTFNVSIPGGSTNPFVTATSLHVVPNVELTHSGDSINQSGDNDYFRFTVGSAGTIRLDTDAREQGLSNVDTVLYLYGSDEVELASNDDGTDPETGYRGLDSALEYHVDTAGTYYARVRGFGSTTGAYILEALFTPDDLGTEPNNSIGESAALNVIPNVELTHIGDSIDQSGDRDYFSFSMAGPGTISLDTDAREQGLSSVDTVLYLYDSSGQELARNDDGTDPDTGYRGLDSALEFHVDTGGTYYAMVRGFGSSVGAYNLAIEVTPDAVTDPYESNNSFETAADLSVSAGNEFTTSGAVISTGGDNDYFSFSMAGPGTISLDTDAREQGLSSVDTVLYLYDSSGQELARNDDGTDPDTGYRGLDSALEFHVDAAGTYYARVRGFGSSEGAYNLSINVTADAVTDPYESNNSFETAADLSVSAGHEFTTSGAVISTGGDNDYFSFSMAGPGTISLDTDAREQGLSSVDTVLYLYDSSGQELARNDDGTDPDTGYRGLDSALEFHVDAAGTYYARVRGFGSSEGAYNLSINVTADAVTDPYESNNSFETAADLSVSAGNEFTTSGAVISTGGDNDYFSFSMAGPGTISLDTDAREQGLSSVDTVLYLYDSSGQELARNDDGTDPDTGYRGLDSALEFHVDAAGTYYARVRGFGSSEGAYNLSINVTADAVTDPYESNNSFETAADLSVSAGHEFTTSGAVISTGGDNDYFSFSMAGPGTISLDTDAREQGLSSVDTVLYLYDSSGQELARNDDGTDPDTGYRGLDSALEFHVDAAGTYYARVRGFGSSEGAYNLSINVTADAVTDPYESNNSFETAADLSVSAGHEFTTSGAVISTGGDNDYFSFSMAGPGTISLDTDAREQGLSSVDTVLYLYDSSGQELARNDDGTDPDTGYRGLDSALEFHVDAAGTYYARVRGFGSSEGAYNLSINVTADAGESDPYEDNNDFGSAALISVTEGREFTTNGASIGSVGDNDYYRFTVGTAGTISLDTDAREQGLSSVDTVLYLYDSSGNQLARNDDGIDPDSGYRGLDSVIERHVEAGEYVARVHGFGSSTGDYNLEILVTPDSSGPSSGDIGDTLATAREVTDVSLGRRYEHTSRIGDANGNNDVDMYRLSLSANVNLSIDTDARENGSTVDTVLRLFDASGNELARNDDATDPDSGYRGLDSLIEYIIPSAGTYYVGVSSYRNFTYDPNTAGSGTGNSQGTYTLQISLDDIVAPPNPNPTPQPVPQQVIYLNFDGGTFRLSGRNTTIPAFDATDFGFSSSQQQQLINTTVQFVVDDFISSGSFSDPGTPLNLPVTIVTDRPDSGEFTTIFVGGASSSLGVAQSIDVGNRNLSDDAAVYSRTIGEYVTRIEGRQLTLSEAAQSLADTISHEAGHVLGLYHLHEDGLLMQNGFVDQSRIDDERFGSGNRVEYDRSGREYRYGPQDSVATLRQNLRLSADAAGINDSIENAFEVITNTGVTTAISGEIDRNDDRDLFGISVTAGDVIRIDVDAQSLGSALDSQVRLLSQTEEVVASNDNSVDQDTLIPTRDSYLEHTFTESGTFYVEVSGSFVGASRPGISAGAYALTISQSSAEIEQSFDALIPERPDKGTVLLSGEQFTFQDANGEQIRVEWSGPGSAVVNLDHDATDNADIASILVRDSGTGSTLLVDSTQFGATTSIGLVSVTGTQPIDITLGASNLSVSLERFASAVDLNRVELNGQLDGQFTVDGNVGTFIVGAVAETGLVDVTGDLQSLNVVASVNGPINVNGTIGSVVIGGDLVGNLSGSSLSAIQIDGDFGVGLQATENNEILLADHNNLLEITGTTGTVTVGGSVFGTIRAHQGLSSLNVGDRLSGVVRSDDGSLGEISIGVDGDGIGILESNGNSVLNFTLNGLGTAEHSIVVLNDSDVTPDLELRDSAGNVLSTGLLAGQRISLAGYAAGNYSIALGTGATGSYSFTVDTQTDAVDPDFAALDLDGDGAVGFETDGVLLALYNLGLRDSQIDQFLVPGSQRDGTQVTQQISQLADALDFDGNGLIGFETDGVLLALYNLGLRGSQLNQFIIGGALREGTAVTQRFGGLLDRDDSVQAGRPAADINSVVRLPESPIESEPIEPVSVAIPPSLQADVSSGLVVESPAVEGGMDDGFERDTIVDSEAIDEAFDLDLMPSFDLV